MMRSLRTGLFGVLAAATLMAGPLEAQRGSQGRRGFQDRERLEQRIRAQMGRMMRERLGLDEDQASRLSDVVQSFDQERRELFRLEQATRRRVEALMLESDRDQQEAAGLLDRMTELRVREAELFAEEQAALLDVLTPIQVLEFQSLREQTGRRIRALRGGRRGESGSRRRGGRPGRNPGMDGLAWFR